MTTTYSTTVYALGTESLGTAPLGLSEEVVTETVSTQSGVRYLDPVTRDYAIRDGELLLASPARQRVIILLVTELRTSLAVKGIKFPAKHDETTERTVRAEVHRTLQPLVDEGAIALQEVTVRREASGVIGRLGIRVSFIDLETEEEDDVNV
jgi:hypothetical protein